MNDHVTRGRQDDHDHPRRRWVARIAVTAVLIIIAIILWILWHRQYQIINHNTTNQTVMTDQSGIKAMIQATTATLLDQMPKDAVSFNDIDPNMWADAFEKGLVLTQSNAETYLDSMFVESRETVNTDTIEGTFGEGLNLKRGSVKLGEYTTGDYVKSILAGTGLTSVYDATTNNTALTLKVSDGLSLTGDGVAAKVKTGGGIVTSPDGLRLVNCSASQLLKWDGSSSSWQCGNDISGGGALSVLETDDLSGGTIASRLEFGPTTDSTGEFAVTDMGGGTLRVRTGSLIPLTNQDVTIDGNWTFAGPVELQAGLDCADCITLGTETTGSYLAGLSVGDGLTITGTGGEGATPTISLDMTQSLTWDAPQHFAGGITLGELELGGQNYVNLSGTGLSLNGGTLSARLGDSVDSNEIVDGTISGNDIANGALSLLHLGQNGCTNTQTIKWNGSNWACANDIDTDTNTTYTAGSGLNLSGSVFGVDTTQSLDWQAAQTFTGGLSLTALTLNGQTYSNLAGTGLSLSGGTLSTTLGTSIDSSEIVNGTITAADIANGTLTFALLGQNGCSATQTLKWNGSSWACAADIDTNTTYTAGNGLGLSGSAFAIDSAQSIDWQALQTFSAGASLSSLTMGGRTYSNFVGTGLSFSTGTLSTTLGTAIDSSEIIDGTITAADIANGAITFALLGQNGCTINQIMKWNGTTWACAVDVDTDTNTTYTAGAGLTLNTTTFTANLNSNGGLTTVSNGLSLLSTCSDGQYLRWTQSTTSWGCASVATIPNLFQTVSGDSGSAIADSTSDTMTIVGGNGIVTTGSNVADTLTVDIDLASGGGLTFTGGALSLMSCSDGQILKRVNSAWACAADNIGAQLATAYAFQVAASDNVTINSGGIPLLTNGSGTPQSLPITITSNNKVAITATIETASSIASGPVLYWLVRDDNADGDCGTGGGDGVQIGGILSTILGTVAQAVTTTFSFVDLSPPSTTPRYQLCASTTISLGATVATDRSLRLDERYF